MSMEDRVACGWGMDEAPPLRGDPFELARSSCAHAVRIARDVSIDPLVLRRFSEELDVAAINNLPLGSLGENCDTVSDDFRSAEEAANFALLFCLLQFGHGFRRELHQHCGRGASRTITLGVRALRDAGSFNAARFRALTASDVRQAFGLPNVPVLDVFVQQLLAVLHQAGTVLERLQVEDFAAFCRLAFKVPSADQTPAATLVSQLAHHFPAFNDQGGLHDGSRVVLVKKAALAIGELRRLAAPHDPQYRFAQDYQQSVAPIDNVIPAMLVYSGILRLSPDLHRQIHDVHALLARGPQEAELRAVALVACDQIVAASDHAINAVDLGYHLWRSGKEAGKRQFARHHTQDTVFY